MSKCLELSKKKKANFFSLLAAGFTGLWGNFPSFVAGFTDLLNVSTLLCYKNIYEKVAQTGKIPLDIGVEECAGVPPY
jgi:hypothetical protein